MAEEIPDILVISEGEFPSTVKSINWTGIEIGDLPHIAEFDVVIINLAGLTPAEAKIFLETPELDISRFHNLLMAGQHLIIITDGRTKFPDVNKPIFNNLPLDIPIVKERGDTVIVENKTYEGYFSYVDSWNFYYNNGDIYIDGWASHELSKLIKLGNVYYAGPVTIAKNKFKKPISFLVRYGIESKYKKIASGPILFLPSTGAIESDILAINSLLPIYGIHVETAAPSWVNEFKIPGEESIIGNIKKTK